MAKTGLAKVGPFRAAVLPSIFLVEDHECLIDLCIRDERAFCHQNVLEELLQGLVVASGVFHCTVEWSVQEGEGFFGMSVHRRCAVGDESPSLPTHVGIGLLLGGRRIGFVPLPLFRVQSGILQGFHLVDIRRFQRPEAMFVLLIVGSTTR